MEHLANVEPADSEIETTEFRVPRDLFGPLDLHEPLDPTNPAIAVFDAFDIAPTWVEKIEALRDEESEAA